MLELPDAAIGSIVAAMIAGFVFFLGLVVSKDQKISEFRQAWIDALRKDASTLIANANVIAGFRATSGSEATPFELFKETNKNYMTINEAEASIMMRLNPKENLSKSVLETMRELEAILDHSKTDMDYDALTSAQKKLLRQMNVVFKKEWKRVKRGEPFYLITKSMMVLIVLSLFLISSLSLISPDVVHRIPLKAIKSKSLL